LNHAGVGASPKLIFGTFAASFQKSGPVEYTPLLPKSPKPKRDASSTGIPVPSSLLGAAPKPVLGIGNGVSGALSVEHVPGVKPLVLPDGDADAAMALIGGTSSIDESARSVLGNSASAKEAYGEITTPFSCR